jgi:hypothetical protein
VTPTFTISDTPLPTATPNVPVVLNYNIWHPRKGPLHISVKAPQAGRVVVHVFNMGAELVRTPFEEDVPADITQDTVWDGNNGSGEPCAAGVYIVSVRGAGIQRTLKVVLLK